MRVRVPGVVVRAESKERMGMRRASAKGVRGRYIVRMLGWACKYGLRVNFDLHTIPASQNGYNHSGKLGHLNFLNGIMGVANARRAMDYIRIIVEFILQPEYADPIPIFGIVNEALVSTIGIEQITSFYLEAHDMIRSITGYGAGHGPFISIHDGFMGVATWAGFLPGSDGIVLDTQPSFAFDQQPNDAPIATSTDPASAGGTWPTQACNAARAIDGRTAFGVTVAGEFSNGYNDCPHGRQRHADLRRGLLAVARLFDVECDGQRGPDAVCPCKHGRDARLVLLDMEDRQRDGRRELASVPARPRGRVDAHGPAHVFRDVRRAQPRQRALQWHLQRVADGRRWRGHCRAHRYRVLRDVAARDDLGYRNCGADGDADVHADGERRHADVRDADTEWERKQGDGDAEGERWGWVGRPERYGPGGDVCCGVHVHRCVKRA